VINFSPSSHLNDCCDLPQTTSPEEPAETKSQKNYQNFIAMSQQAKELIIENGASDGSAENVDKVDKDEKEMKKASQEINRSNRKLIKQSFNSNVLEIEAEKNACGGAEGGSSEIKLNEAVNKEESDDWDTL
jgi:hypothetical protein